MSTESVRHSPDENHAVFDGKYEEAFDIIRGEVGGVLLVWLVQVHYKVVEHCAGVSTGTGLIFDAAEKMPTKFCLLM